MSSDTADLIIAAGTVHAMAEGAAPVTGTLVPGAPADLVAYRADPFTCPGEELPGLSPAATVIAGRLAHEGG